MAFVDTRAWHRGTQALLATDVVRSFVKSGAPGQAQSPVAGFLWVTAATLAFVGLGAFAKAAMQAGVPAFEVVFIRNLMCVVLMSPLLLIRGRELLQVSSPKLHAVRISLSFVSMMCWFTAISMIPFTELTAISFLSPLFATLFAVLYLGEVVRGRRWTALGFGFLGAMIMLRPGLGEFQAGQVVALFGALTMGMIGPLLKELSNKDDADKIVFCWNVGLVPLSLVPALFVWVWPSVEVLPILFCMGLAAVLGHVCLMRGFAAIDASLVATFEFSKLPFAVVVGWFVFAEPTDFWTIVGASIIFVSALYITRREAQLARERSGKVKARSVSDPLGLTPVEWRLGTRGY